MKTIITIEPSRVTVQVDENSPIQIQTSPPAKKEQGSNPHFSVDQKNENPTGRSIQINKASSAGLAKIPTQKPHRNCAICGEDISHLHPLRRLCLKRECRLEQQRISGRKSYNKLHGITEPEKRACVMCGDDITGTRGNRVVCSKPECKKKLIQRKKADWFARKRNDPEYQGRARINQQKYRAKKSPERVQSRPRVEYGRSIRKPIKPQFLPGHEKTPQEIATWQPTNTGLDQPIPRATTDDVSTSNFADPWNCDACRRRSELCPFHQGMVDEGKTPPKLRTEVRR